jgi:hypothetical protein
MDGFFSFSFWNIESFIICPCSQATSSQSQSKGEKLEGTREASWDGWNGFIYLSL